MSNAILDMKDLKPGDVVQVKTHGDHWWIGITKQTICHDTAAVGLMIMTSSAGLQHKYSDPSSSSSNPRLWCGGELTINNAVRGTVTELYVNYKPFK